MTKHSFGGHWTELKLKILKNYLGFYTSALKNQPFKLLYIDAFAGTGERQQIIPEAPILKEEAYEETLAGSARIALEIDPPFFEYHFIEQNSKRFERLKSIAAEYEDRRCYFYNGDANEELRYIINKHIRTGSRAVLFLDPYGLSVDWETLKFINETGVIDVWYLFPLSGFIRQAAIKFDDIEPYKIEALNRLLGTTDWKEVFYSDEYKPQQADLFSAPAERTERTATPVEFENYVKKRLDSVFNYVHEPVGLPKTGAQLYSLFLCVSNPNRKAIDLAKRVARDIIRNS